MIIDPSGVVWAMSALSIMVVIITVYFAIFWMMMIAIFAGIGLVWRAVFAFLTYEIH